MKINDVIQGSPKWLADRMNTYNASDAPAMLDCSPYESRNELIARLATGISPEVTPEMQRRFDDGHRFEALARPLAVEIIGEELYPISGSEDFGLDKPLGASLDGATITDEILWEHKSLNDELRRILPEPIVGEVFVGSAALGAKLPKVYRVQMEQQLMVDSDAIKVLFTASKWKADETLEEARHCWYESDPALRAEILAGWKQLAEDVKAYVPPAAAPVVVAEPVQALPAVMVQVSGSIALKDNFKAFETALRDFLDNRLIREPKTDQDFADLELQIRAMKAAEDALDSAESQMLAQVQAVDAAKKTKDMLRALTTENRIMAEKLVKSEKERRRGEIVAGGVAEFAKHMAALNERLGKPYMPTVQADFGGAVKGLKSMASMENAVATELARVKIAANEIADRLQANLTYLRENAKDYAFLFADTAEIIKKAPDDLQALVQNRINAHKQAEEKRLEAERAAIRAEEERKAQAAAQAEQDRIREEAAEKNEMALQEIQGIQQQVMIATLGRAGVRKGGTIECIRETLAETETWTITEEKFGVLTTAAQAAKDKAIADIRALLSEAEAKAATQTTIAAAAQSSAPATTKEATAPTLNQVLTAVAPVAVQRAMGVPESLMATAGQDEQPTLKLGEICERLGFTVTAEFLASLGFQATVVRNARMYRESQWPAICEALIQHITQVADLQVA